MSYWNGHAPNYSRAVEAAKEKVDAAEKAMIEVMQREYPRGRHVRVVHHRGEFDATVIGWDTHGVRIVVENHATGNVSKWWAAHVEIAAAAKPSGEGN